MSKLYFRYGAMNCGKSSALMQVAYNYEQNNKKDDCRDRRTDGFRFVGGLWSTEHDQLVE